MRSSPNRSEMKPGDVRQRNVMESRREYERKNARGAKQVNPMFSQVWVVSKNCFVWLSTSTLVSKRECVNVCTKVKKHTTREVQAPH